MSATITNIYVLNHAAGFTSWLYKGAQTRKGVDAPGYFNVMYGMCAVGDTIVIVCTDGVAMRCVASIADGVVKLGSVA